MADPLPSKPDYLLLKRESEHSLVSSCVFICEFSKSRFCSEEKRLKKQAEKEKERAEKDAAKAAAAPAGTKVFD